MELQKKVKILSIAVGVISVSFIGFWLYNKRKYQLLDERVDSKEDALRILEEARIKSGDTGGLGLYVGGNAPYTDGSENFEKAYETYDFPNINEYYFAYGEY